VEKDEENTASREVCGTQVKHELAANFAEGCEIFIMN
jgi:hypothetical protein